MKTRAQFQAVMAGGVVARTPHFALHRLSLPQASLQQLTTVTAPPDLSSPRPSWCLPAPLFGAQNEAWLGALVPKRWARRAVTRNAIRRQIYALGDVHAHGFHLAGHVVRLRSAFDKRQFVSAWSEPLRLAVRRELELLFQRATHAPEVAPQSTRDQPQQSVSAS